MFARDPDLLAAVGPRVRKSPFFDATVADGLHSVSTYNHMWLPMGYGDPDAEYRRLTEGVSMWDVAAQRHVAVAGPDADRFVQKVTAIDVRQVDRGRAGYAPVVEHDGTLINDPVLFHWADGSWRFSISDSDLRFWLAALAREQRADVTVRELATATLAVQGPVSYEVMAGLGIDWLEEAPRFECRTAQIAGPGGTVEVTVSHSGWSSQGGAELFLDDPAQANDLWRTVAAAGKRHDIGPGAPNVAERIENVLLSYGTDTGYEADPIELGLESVLDLDGPDFIGRDALIRIVDVGPDRHLVGALIDGPPIESLPDPVSMLAGGRRVGQLRAATRSPRYGRNIGLALVSSDVAAGTEVHIERAGDTRTARLVELPFSDVLDG